MGYGEVQCGMRANCKFYNIVSIVGQFLGLVEILLIRLTLRLIQSIGY